MTQHKSRFAVLDFTVESHEKHVELIYSRGPLEHKIVVCFRSLLRMVAEPNTGFALPLV